MHIYLKNQINTFYILLQLAHDPQGDEEPEANLMKKKHVGEKSN